MTLLHFLSIGISVVVQAQSPTGPLQEYNQANSNQQTNATSGNIPKNKTISANSAYGSAISGQKANSSAGMISNLIGTGLLSAGKKAMPHCCGKGHCCNKAVTMVSMGIMGLMQGAANNSTSDQHGLVAIDSGVKGLVGPGSPGSAEALQSEINSGLKSLQDVGANFDSKNGKVTFPDGKSVGLSSLGDPSAMASAGVSSDDMKQIQKNLNELQAAAIGKAATLKENTTETEYVPGSVTTMNGGSGSNSEDSGVAASAKASGDRELAAVSVAGMSKNYNGDLIGVSGDNIFNMMARRYQQKSKDDSFLAPESSPNSALSGFKQ